MRKILMATLVVAGIGFVGASTTQAAPVSTGVLQQLTDMNKSDVTQVGFGMAVGAATGVGAAAAAVAAVAGATCGGGAGGTGADRHPGHLDFDRGSRVRLRQGPKWP